MSLHGVDNHRGLLVLSAQAGSKLDMGSLHVVVDRLADVMQQAGTLCRPHVHAHFGSQKSRKMRNLYGMLQGVLPVLVR